MNEEMTSISAKELEQLKGFKSLYEKHVLKLGGKKKELNSQCADFVSSNIDDMSILGMFNSCKDKGLDMEYSAFRKYVIDKEVKDFYAKGMTPDKIVEAMKTKRKHSRMGESAVVKVLEKMGYNSEKQIKGLETPEDTKRLVDRMISWKDHDIPTITVMSEIDVYKVMIMSQPDNSVLYIPKEILRQFKYKLIKILDKNIDMTFCEALCILRIDKCELIGMAREETDSEMTRIHLIKSGMPLTDKIYDIEQIKNKYFAWRSKQNTTNNR